MKEWSYIQPEFKQNLVFVSRKCVVCLQIDKGRFVYI